MKNAKVFKETPVSTMHILLLCLFRGTLPISPLCWIVHPVSPLKQGSPQGSQRVPGSVHPGHGTTERLRFF